MAKEKKKPLRVATPSGWYYMNKTSMTVEDLARGFDADLYDIEVWVEAGVLEVGVAEKLSIDIEQCELDLGDEYSNEFIADNGINSVFYISFKSSEEEKCMPILKEMLTRLDGMLCADSDDFSPIIRVS